MVPGIAKLLVLLWFDFSQRQEQLPIVVALFNLKCDPRVLLRDCFKHLASGRHNALTCRACYFESK